MVDVAQLQKRCAAAGLPEYFAFFALKKALNIKHSALLAGNLSRRRNQETRLKLCLIQWYEFWNENLLCINNIDRVLNCIRLKWAKHPGELLALSAGKELGVALQQITTSFVSVVPKGSFWTSFDSQNCEKVHVGKLDAGTLGWKAKWSFVSRIQSTGCDDFNFFSR